MKILKDILRRLLNIDVQNSKPGEQDHKNNNIHKHGSLKIQSFYVQKSIKVIQEKIKAKRQCLVRSCERILR